MAPTPLEAIAQTNPYFTRPLTPLDPLPYPVYFVTMNPKWQDVMTQPELLDNPEAIYQRCVKTNPRIL